MSRARVTAPINVGILVVAINACTAPSQSVASPPMTASSAETPKATVASPVTPKPVPISSAPWGTADGKAVTLYTLTNANGLVMKVATYGGIITELYVPDRHGALSDIVLGFDNLDGYQKSSPYFGAVIGRVANRIQDAKFELEGKTYKLAANNGKNSLHGGNKGWDKVVWKAEPKDTPGGPSLKLTYTSKNGEEGYPGTVSASNTYTLTNKNELKIEMAATTDQTTIINMAHHTYWNLAGHDSGPVVAQELWINADKYTPVDPLIGTASGRVEPVKGTPFDFTTPKPIGRDLQAAGGTPVGFDTNWIVAGEPLKLRATARVTDPKSGRVLAVDGDQPGVQFYSGNFLDGSIKGKRGTVYPQYGGLCLETQKFPNSVNVPGWKDAVVLKPGQTYTSTMILSFTTE